MTSHDAAALQAAIQAAAIQHAEYRGWTEPEPEDFAIAEDMLAAARPYLAADAAATMRERIAAESIRAIARYVLSRSDGEARGVTEFVADLLRQHTTTQGAPS